MLWHCWLGDRKGIRPAKKRVVGCWHGCLERGADLHMAQLMSLPLTVSCFTKILIGFTFLVPAYPVFPDKGPSNTCVCVHQYCVPVMYWCDYPGLCDCCACYSNRPEKRFAFKDARLPPKPAGRGVEFKTGDQVEVTRQRLLWVFILRVAIKKSLTNAKLLGRLAAQKFWHAPLGLCSAIYGACEWTCGKKISHLVHTR